MAHVSSIAVLRCSWGFLLPWLRPDASGCPGPGGVPERRRCQMSPRPGSCSMLAASWIQILPRWFFGLMMWHVEGWQKNESEWTIRSACSGCACAARASGSLVVVWSCCSIWGRNMWADLPVGKICSVVRAVSLGVWCCSESSGVYYLAGCWGRRYA